MINTHQNDDLERPQKWTLKTIYGWKTSYSFSLQNSGFPTLKDRRDQILLHAANARFRTHIKPEEIQGRPCEN